MNAVAEKLLDRIKEACSNGPISYRDYTDLVLYADGCGYYKRDQQRVGRNKNTDFYTAESLGQVFSQLVTTAACDLLGKDIAAKPTRAFPSVSLPPSPGDNRCRSISGSAPSPPDHFGPLPRDP